MVTVEEKVIVDLQFDLDLHSECCHLLYSFMFWCLVTNIHDVNGTKHVASSATKHLLPLCVIYGAP